VLDEKGYILSVKKNGLQILIPKYGLEGTVYFNNTDESKKRKDTVEPLFVYNEQVRTNGSCNHWYR